MQLSLYQSAAKATAVYPGHLQVTYPALGLVGEIGEIANKVKKIFRDDGGEITIAKRGQLSAEIGDAMWYVAAVATDLGLGLQDHWHLLPKYLPPIERVPLTLASISGSIAGAVNALAMGESVDYVRGRVNDTLEQVVHHLCALAYHIGIDFPSILQANLDKLTSRQERGTLLGDGDNR